LVCWKYFGVKWKLPVFRTRGEVILGAFLSAERAHALITSLATLQFFGNLLVEAVQLTENVAAASTNYFPWPAF